MTGLGAGGFDAALTALLVAEWDAGRGTPPRRRADRAARAPGAGRDLVVAIDTLVSGVHFPVETDPFDVGHKALAVNLSDLAAMGAEPLAASVSVTAPAGDDGWARGVARGAAALARREGVAPGALAAHRGAASVTVEAHGGIARGAGLRRAGARPGDLVYVSGTLGDAGGALALWRGETDAAPAERAALAARLARPEPRVRLGQAALPIARAAIDVSDGLVQDLGHVAAASAVRVIVEFERLPVSAALRTVLGPERARRVAATAGDDYELCLAVAPARAAALEAAAAGLGVPLTRIGRIEAGAGVTLVDAGGAALAAGPGYRHFAARAGDPPG